MPRKKLKSQTEWLIATQRPRFEGVHSAVVYRLQTTIDQETGESKLRKLWVAARGYAGGGIIEPYSGVIFPEGDGVRKVGCNYAYAELGDFDEAEQDYLQPNDQKVIRSLWFKMKRLAAEDEDEDGNTLSFTARIEIPRRAKNVCSTNWNGNVLVQMSDGWPLFLHFKDERPKREQLKYPLPTLLPRPAGVEE
jgi:hypothetical protein